MLAFCANFDAGITFWNNISQYTMILPLPWIFQVGLPLACLLAWTLAPPVGEPNQLYTM